MNRITLLLALLCALLLSGCASPEKAFIGSWTASGQTLDLKEDKTFTLSGQAPMDGTWSVKEKKATLIPKNLGGKPIDQFLDENAKAAAKMGIPKSQIDAGLAQIRERLKSIEVTMDDDGKSINAPGPTGSPVKMTKVEGK